MKGSAFSALVAALGLFSLVAQTLLFRTHLGALEGSELAIGSFFGSWLLWVFVGALVARGVLRGFGGTPTRLALFSLFYLPAFALQQALVLGARDLAGVPAYEVLPLGALLGVSLLVHAPVSTLTGFLFVLACKSAERTSTLPVARVWVLECLGAFVGGLLVTLLLTLGVEPSTVALVGGLLLAAAAAGVAWRGRHAWLAALPVVLLAVALATGVGTHIDDVRDRDAWAHLLPPETFAGSFSTPQARYLYGEREGVFHVVSWGVTAEVVPDRQRAGEVTALHLAQVPEARRVVVVGSGSLAIVLGLAGLERVDRVAWLHPDPSYPRALLEVLPPDLARAAADVVVPGEGVKAFLVREEGAWDLVILNLPDVTTLVRNRYATREFHELARRALVPDGVLSLRITGGENVMGEELALLGASALVTLESVFAHVVLKPGEETWLLASDGASLTEAPGTLQERWGSVRGADALYDPAAVFSLYAPAMVRRQREAYGDAIRAQGTELLLNTEDDPKALLYGLVASARRGGRAVSMTGLRSLLSVGAIVLAIGIALYGLLRVLYLRGGAPHAVPSGPDPRGRTFDAGFLVFSTGLVGMALGVVLMFAYQTRFGSLYVDVGGVSALFMLGLFLGGSGAARLLGRHDGEAGWMLPAAVGLSVVVLALVALLPGDAPRSWLATLLVLAGISSGAFFPLAAHRFRESGREPLAAGAALESVDHLGGAVGAVATGLILLPLFGVTTTLGLLALLVLVNLLPPFVPHRERLTPVAEKRTDATLRAVGYALVGITLFVLVGSVAARATRDDRQVERAEALACELAGGAALVRERTNLADGIGATWWRVAGEAGEAGGWILATSDWAPDVQGYGGPLNLLAHIDTEGRLVGFAPFDARETPTYVALLDDWRSQLTGRDVFAPAPFENVDAVTGATVTAEAMLSALEEAGRRFAWVVLGREVAGHPRPTRSRIDLDLLVLVFLTVGAIALRYRPNAWVRRVWLVAVLVASGLWLNAQYASHHVFLLLNLELPGALLGVGAFLVLAIPLVVTLFGNVYCGWLCPFGAAQELMGEIGRRRWRIDPDPVVWRWGRAVKYALLALVITVAVVAGRPEVMGADPLVAFFSGHLVGVALTLAVLVLLLSLIFGRFFCRNLCPAGAFLALLGRVALLRRWLPEPRTPRCDLGVRSRREFDCICCDRCRHA